MAISAVAGLAGALGAGAAGLAVGAAFWATVFSTAGLAGFAIGAGLSILNRALMPKLDTKQLEGLTTTTRNPVATRKIIYGQTRIGGNIVYLGTSGEKNKYLHFAIVFASHEVEEITEIYFDDKVIWTNGGFTSGWGTYVALNIHDGTQTHGVSTGDSLLKAGFANTWTDDHILEGIAWVSIRMEYDTDQFTTGIPNITAKIKGRKVFDPRSGLTVWSNNPALCLYDYMRDQEFGLGESASNFNLQSVIDAANLCDEQVAVTAGGTQNRYAISGVIDTGNSIKTNIEAITSAMAGFVTYSGGEFFMYGAEYRAPVMTITEDMIIGEMSLQTRQSRKDLYNAVRGTFISEDDNYVATDYPVQSSSLYATEDSDTIFMDMVLPMTTSQATAQRIAKIALLKSRQQKAITIPMNMNALKFKAGDTIAVTSEKLGFTAKEFEVVGFEIAYQDSIAVNVQAIETDPDIYDWTVDQEQPYDFGGTIPLYDGQPVAPTGLQINTSTVLQSDGTATSYFDVVWVASDDAFVDYYIVSWTVDGVTSSYNTRETTHRIMATSLNQYTFNVKAVNLLGATSASISDVATASLDLTAPSAPTNLVATGGLRNITLTWTNPVDTDFKHVEVYYADTNVIPVSPSALVDGESFTLSGLSSNTLKYFWLKSVDFTGNKSGATASVSATSDRLTSDDFAAGIIDFDFFDDPLKGIINDKIDTATYNLGVTTINESIALKADAIDVDVIIGEVSDTRYDAIDLAENVLKNALDTHRNAKTMSDAGITVNPNDGTVYIYALDVYKGVTDSRLGSAEIRLDGAESTINLKAEYTYVDQKIAEANFDPSQVADLTDLFLRVGTAEADIDAANSNINLKADLVLLNDPVTGIDVRVSTAEADIDALEGQITLKVSTSDFEGLESRVGTAETTLNSIDAPSIAQTVTDVLFLSDEIIDLSNTSLEGLLAFYKDRKETMAALARARQMLTADVIDARNVSAEYRLELLAKTDANEASIISESLARIAEDESLASEITTLKVNTDANTASLIETNSVLTTATTAISENKLEIDARLDTAEGNITQINTVNLSSTSAIAQSVAQLQLDVGESGLAGQIQDIQDIVSSEGSIRANDIKTLAVTQGYKITDLEEKTFDDILRGYEDRKTLQAALAIARQSLTADINDSREAFASYRLELAAAIDDNVARITQESLTRATEDSALAQTISELSVEVGNNSAAISTEQVTRATETSANASAITTLQATVNDPVTGVAKSAADIVQINNVSATSGSAIAKAVHGVTSTYDGFTSTITTTAQSVDGIKNQYTVTINNNNFVSGFGLVSDIIDGNPTSAFKVQADQFYVANGVTEDVPFIVYTTATDVVKNGEIINIPAGVYMKDAAIQNAAITMANIQDSIQSTNFDDTNKTGWRIYKDGTFKFYNNGALLLGATGVPYAQVTDGPPSNADNTASNNQPASWITSSALATGVEIKSTNYVADTSGWSIKADGSAEFDSATIRGTLKAGQIQLDGVTLTASGDNVIIAGGGVNTNELATESATAARVATGSKLSWAAINTYYDICTITLDVIANQPVILDAIGRFYELSSIGNARAVGLRFVRDTTTLDTFVITKSSTDQSYSTILPALYMDTPTTTGSVTYKLQASVAHLLTDLTAATLTVLQAKR